MLLSPGYRAARAVDGNCADHSMPSSKQPLFQIAGGRQLTGPDNRLCLERQALRESTINKSAGNLTPLGPIKPYAERKTVNAAPLNSLPSAVSISRQETGKRPKRSDSRSRASQTRPPGRCLNLVQSLRGIRGKPGRMRGKNSENSCCQVGGVALFIAASAPVLVRG